MVPLHYHANILDPEHLLAQAFRYIFAKTSRTISPGPQA
jgi:hypothetical protein